MCAHVFLPFRTINTAYVRARARSMHDISWGTKEGSAHELALTALKKKQIVKIDAKGGGSKARARDCSAPDGCPQRTGRVMLCRLGPRLVRMTGCAAGAQHARELQRCCTACRGQEDRGMNILCIAACACSLRENVFDLI